MIAIIDYGAGNLRSIERALNQNGASTVVTGEPDTIAAAEAIVFPGVGNARAAMDHLRRSGVAEAITSSVAEGTPLLGICLGMQLLFGEQEEGPTTGLGLLQGRGIALPPGRKSPHMGWNTVRFQASNQLSNLSDHAYYFVHSYIVDGLDPHDIAGLSTYGVTFPSMVAHENIWGTQFHPEKSGDAGVELVGVWLSFVQRQQRP